MRYLSSILVLFIVLIGGSFFGGMASAENVALQWAANFDGPEGGDDSAVAASMDGLGNLCVTGTSAGGVTGLDILVLKYGPDGDPLWNMRYSGAGDDVAGAIAADLSGTVFVAGTTRSAGGDLDILLIKYGAAGSELWTVSYDGLVGDDDGLGSMVLDRSRNIYLTGRTGDGDGGSRAVTLKYDSAGGLQWCVVANDPDTEGAALAVDGDGAVYLAGTSGATGGHGDYFLIKYDAQGNELWASNYNGPASGMDLALAVCPDGSGGALVAGCSEGGGGASELATAAFDGSGNRRWVSRAGGTWDGVDPCASIALDAQGYAVVSGCCTDGAGSREQVTLRYDLAGNELWADRRMSPEGTGSAPVSLVVGRNGAVYLAGLAHQERSGSTFALAKLNPAGEEQWSTGYLTSGPAAASSLVVDRAGRVFVTGWSAESGGDREITTLRYDQESGTRLTLATATPCAQPGSQVTVTVEMNGALEPVSGGQFFLHYDPARLEFVGASPGSSSFSLEIFEQADQTAGTIDYAVGIPFGGVPSAEDAVMALLTFQTLGSPDGDGPPVSFRNQVPPSRLSTAEGEPVHPSLSGMDSAGSEAPEFTWLPGDITVFSDAGFCTSVVNWPDPEAASASDPEVSVSCDPSSGSALPAGVTTVTCTAVDHCGQTAVSTFDVLVEPYNELVVDLKLFGQMHPGPFQRAMSFELYGPDSAVLEQAVSFTNGLASARILVPCGDYQCISVRDPLHSLKRAMLTLSMEGSCYRANFRAAGKVLVPGNLNDDNWVDILDFGVLIWQWGQQYGSGGTTDSTSWPHADFNGDGRVNQWDFQLFRRAALRGSEGGCSQQPETVPPPVLSVTVDELTAAGMAELAAADLNGDGRVNRQDVIAFMQGARP